MAGFATVNEFINYDYLEKIIERKREEEKEAKKPKNIFPSSQSKCRTCPYVCDKCVEILEGERKNSFIFRSGVSGRHPSHSLCWCCKHSIDNGCEWSALKKPVPGWEAHYDICDTTTKVWSYNVKTCPKFERG